MQVQNRPQLACKQEPSLLAFLLAPLLAPKSPSTQAQRKFLSLESHFSGIASMSVDDKALRNSTVHMQKAQRF